MRQQKIKDSNNREEYEKLEGIEKHSGR